MLKGDFLELIESYREGQAITMAESGETRVGGRGESYLRQLKEATDLLSGYIKGIVPMYRLQEAMSTSDFPILLGDITERRLLAEYQEMPAVWEQFCARGTVRDFRETKSVDLQGGAAPLGAVSELGEYSKRKMAESEYKYKVGKYGAKIDLSWESIVNDNLNAFLRLPSTLARAARMTEQRTASGMYVGTAGPNGSLYTAGNKNIITGNPALTVDGLSTGLKCFGTQVDSDGNPIFLESTILVVPPSLKLAALAILNATEIEIETDTKKKIRTGNYLKSALKLVVDPYIPLLATTNAETSWFLFADPANGRHSIEVGFLRGHEAPELFVKTPNSQRVNGGASSPDDGSFENDSKEYKVRHVVGAGYFDPKLTFASNGTGQA